MNKMRSLCALVFVAFFGCVLSDRPNDQINVPAFNRTFFIANETYSFQLDPQYQVPLQVRRHIIYTATTETVTTSIKRGLWQNKKRGVELSLEDHELLSSILQEALPSYVKVNAKKRSVSYDGLRYISLGKDAAVLFMDAEETMKRGVPLGTASCYHIPFVTTCANSGDLQAIKDTLSTQVNAFRTELDSYKRTNDARASEMARVLNRQRSLIQTFAAEAGQTAILIDAVASAAASNAAAQAHGDYVAHAQINYLKRVTNSLLRFSNAMASSDARSVVAQPSMTKLFTGFKTVISYLQTVDIPNNKTVAYQPILDTRTFNWTENPLPVDSVKNRVDVPFDFVDPNTVLIQQVVGFLAVTNAYCDIEPNVATQNFRCTNGSTPKRGSIAIKNQGADQGDHWFLGPFHEGHLGMYTISMTNPNSTCSTVAYFNVSDAFSGGAFAPQIDGGATPVNQLYCVDFLGFKALTTFNFTPNMLNGIAAPTVSPLSDCANYLFKQDTIANSANFTKFLIGKIEGVIVPFYSNCDPATIIAETGTTTPIGWMVNWPFINPTAPGAVANSRLYTPYRVNAEHYISARCYINIEPEWLGMQYYFPATPTVVSNIPRGYKLNQFTVNPAGELASSLEFVYTQDWGWVYKITRTSNNTVIVDEVDALDGSLVLFHLKGNNIVDESDSFYGKSNNGRDCIQLDTTYDYDLTSCFFQNDEASYPVDKYLLGNVRTTGIARYTNKFNFGLNNWNTTKDGQPFASYQFVLIPKETADFSYTINFEGSICPKVISSSTSLQSCSYQFYYSGNSSITFGKDLASASAVTFDSNGRSNTVTVTFASSGGQSISNFLYAGSSQCLFITCSYQSAPSIVNVANLTKEVIYASDIALNNSVDFVLSQTADSVKALDSIKDLVNQARTNLSIIQSKLGGLEFNTSKIVPYEDFSELRAKADALIDSLSPTGSRSCANGVFGSVTCWFEDALSTLIVLGILVAVGVGIYCVCIKFNLIGKLCGNSKDF